MSENNVAYQTIDEYIAIYPVEIQEILKKMRQVIKESAPEATEKIGYQMPTFVLHGNLVHFAAFKNHIGFYPTPSAITAFMEKLTEYKCSKGAIQFPLDKPIPYDLIKQIVDYRVAENIRIAQSKMKKK